MIGFVKTMMLAGLPAGARPTNLKHAIALATLTLLALTGCGGDSGESALSNAPPVIATPSPGPAPTPTATQVFGALGQTTSQSFATLGFNFSGVELEYGSIAIEATSVDDNSPIVFRYAAPTQLLLSLNGLGEGTLMPNGGSGTNPQGQLIHLSYKVLGGHASLSSNQFRSGEYATSSGTGFWIGPPSSSGRPISRIAQYAYGVPTLTSQLPAAGAATYDAPISGYVAMASPGGIEGGFSSGTAHLIVNFGTRTVTGTIEIKSSPTYTLSQTALTSDGTGFQGRLTTAGGAPEGFIEGRFTGSSAREMIFRWRAPVTIEERNGLAFGVNVGVVINTG